MLIGGKLPGRASKPESVPRSSGQGLRCIYQRGGRHMRKTRAQLQKDAKPLAAPRTVTHGHGFRLWPAYRHGDPVLKSAHDQFAVADGNGEKRVCALAMAPPDPFDKRRV